MFAIVPAIEGVPQVGLNTLIKARSISETQAVVNFIGDLEEGWQEITEVEFLTYFPIVE
jgi:hypothetical protein